ncbi:MAG: hypothetical protein L0154_13710 [Chloroflexi bacterium]|nr:hypothetical protein [Chloroflexota bacterium]
MTTIQLAGALLVLGCLIVWGAALMPTWRVYATSDPDLREKLINERDNFWIISHLLYIIGAVLTTTGMGIFTSTVEAPDARLLAIAGLAALVLGTLVWVHIVLTFRLLMLSEEYVRTTAGGWTFPTYAVLTLGGLIVHGIVLLLSGFPIWLGVVTIGLNSIILIAFYIQKDSAPPLFYIATLIMGIVFLT